MPIIYYCLLLLIGLCFGSLIALITDRYPLMLYREWNHVPESPCWKKRLDALPKVFNLMLPRSHCNSCQHTLAWYHTIPILSFLMQQGRCVFCQASIPKKTIAIELITACLCFAPVLLIGWNMAALALTILYLILLTLTVIDIEHQLLPDTMTLSLLWLGLLGQTVTHIMPISTADAINGAIVGYAVPWFVAFVFEKVRRKTGLGLGDCKLLAALGAWTGPINALVILFAAAIAALLFAIPMLATKKLNAHTHIPFGPFIAIVGAIVVTLLYCGYSPIDWLAL